MYGTRETSIRRADELIEGQISKVRLNYTKTRRIVVTATFEKLQGSKFAARSATWTFLETDRSFLRTVQEGLLPCFNRLFVQNNRLLRPRVDDQRSFERYCHPVNRLGVIFRLSSWVNHLVRAVRKK